MRFVKNSPERNFRSGERILLFFYIKIFIVNEVFDEVDKTIISDVSLTYRYLEVRHVQCYELVVGQNREELLALMVTEPAGIVKV